MSGVLQSRMMIGTSPASQLGTSAIPAPAHSINMGGELVASLVAFVAGPEAAYITGANLTVDGGTNA